MAALTYFTVVGSYYAATGDSAYDVDTDPDLAPVWGQVTFTPLVDTGDALQANTLSPPSSLLLVPITANIVGGQIKKNAAVGVRLTANTAVLNLDANLYYRVEFTDLISRGQPQTLRSFTFQAPTTDIQVDLVEVSPIPGVAAVGITRGPAGPGVDDVQLVGGDVQFYSEGNPVGDPLVLDVVDITNVDGGSPSSPGDEILDGGTP